MQKVREVVLVTGKKVPLPIVQTVYMSLDLCIARGYTKAIYELLQACRDPEHRMSRESGERLDRIDLIQYFDPRTCRFSINTAISAVIEAAVTDLGDGRVRIKPQQEIIREISK